MLTKGERVWRARLARHNLVWRALLAGVFSSLSTSVVPAIQGISGGSWCAVGRCPLSTPIAWTVAVADKVKGPTYLVLALVGAVPLVV